ncbi:MAG: PH domain-containing protein [Anaeroplasma sp.]
MKRYKPKIDKLFYILLIIVNTLLLAILLIPILVFNSFEGLPFTIIVVLFVDYLLLSSIFGYVEIKENLICIKYGLILKKEIPFNKIKKLEIKRKWYSDSLLALKNSIEHVDITFNSYDKTCVSVKDNYAFVEEVKKKLAL